MKKLCIFVTVFAMLLLAGCSGEAVSPISGMAEGAPRTYEEPVVSGNIKFTNDTGYTFVELYSTASTSTEFGAELLGGMRVDTGIYMDMTIGNINDTQDFLITDEDGDSYSLVGVEVAEGDDIVLTITTDGTNIIPIANVYDSAGNVKSTVQGLFIENENANATGYDSNGNYGFVVNNNSSYEIYSMRVGVANASSSYDIDILPQILGANSSTEVYGFATQGDWLNTEWTLYITDVEGDTSASYDNFNPWTLKSVDISWNNDAGGYVLNFTY